jgi:hypothetical protein
MASRSHERVHPLVVEELTGGRDVERVQPEAMLTRNEDGKRLRPRRHGHLRVDDAVGCDGSACFRLQVRSEVASDVGRRGKRVVPVVPLLGKFGFVS